MQSPAIALTKLPFYEKFTEEGIKKIKDVPMETVEDVNKFSAWVTDSYKNRKEFLKPGADKGISRDNWLEYVYKIHQNKPVLYKRSDPLFSYIQAGIAGLDLQSKKSPKNIAAEPQAIADPSEDEPKKNALCNTKNSNN